MSACCTFLTASWSFSYRFIGGALSKASCSRTSSTNRDDVRFFCFSSFDRARWTRLALNWTGWGSEVSSCRARLLPSRCWASSREVWRNERAVLWFGKPVTSREIWTDAGLRLGSCLGLCRDREPSGVRATRWRLRRRRLDTIQYLHYWHLFGQRLANSAWANHDDSS